VLRHAVVCVPARVHHTVGSALLLAMHLGVAGPAVAGSFITLLGTAQMVAHRVPRVYVKVLIGTKLRWVDIDRRHHCVCVRPVESAIIMCSTHHQQLRYCT
jgi:hypothetical protein